MWLLWVHSCLLKNKHFWVAKIPYKCPWNLRKIFNLRSVALSYLSYSIKADSTFKFWYDPWINSIPLFQQFGEGIISVMDSSPNASVGSMLLNRQWNVSSSNDYRAIQIQTLLSTVPIGNKDDVLWNSESNVKMRVIWDSFCRRGVSFPGFLSSRIS